MATLIGPPFEISSLTWHELLTLEWAQSTYIWLDWQQDRCFRVSCTQRLHAKMFMCPGKVVISFSNSESMANGLIQFWNNIAIKKYLVGEVELIGMMLLLDDFSSRTYQGDELAWLHDGSQVLSCQHKLVRFFPVSTWVSMSNHA